MNLGQTIYRHRTEHNMSQADLADALGVSRQSISKWENNMAVPELDKLIKMSQLFGITLDELVNAPPPPPQPEPEPVKIAGLSTEDLVSVLLLLVGIFLPVVILACESLHRSLFLMVLALFVIPPGVTIAAACVTPKNRTLSRIYVVYDIIFGILAMIAGNVLAPIIAILYLFAVGFWGDKLDDNDESM